MIIEGCTIAPHLDLVVYTAVAIRVEACCAALGSRCRDGALRHSPRSSPISPSLLPSARRPRHDDDRGENVVDKECSLRGVGHMPMASFAARLSQSPITSAQHNIHCCRITGVKLDLVKPRNATERRGVHSSSRWHRWW